MTEFTPQQESLPVSIAHEAAAAVLALEMNPQLYRANEVSEAIDPTHVLPPVEVVNDPAVHVGRGSLVPQPSLIMYNGEPIGSVRL